jgi:ubiquinone/menaquinone biosynthesis C-methylase UbiE
MSSSEYMKNHYVSVVDGGGVGFVKRAIHRLIEKGHDGFVERVLELGAGQGQHRTFVRQDVGLYLEGDLEDLNPTRGESTEFVKLDAQNLEMFPENYFDRIIATCLLTHLTFPEQALKEWRRVAKKENGCIDIWVPCEMGLLLRVAQKLTTRRKVNAKGFNYDSIQHREHRNHFYTMNTLIKEVYDGDDIQIKGFPFSNLPWDFQLVRIYKIRIKDNIA